jgi:guanylate kinase
MWFEKWGQLPGQLVVVSGPSGSGKSSVIREALKCPDLNINLSVSGTTRPPRPGEKDGADYYFYNRDEFIGYRDRGHFLEWAEYNGNLYGTPAAPVCQALETGKSVILEIEVQGALQIRNNAPSALFIFIRTPKFRDLEERLRRRGTEMEPAILRRLRKAREELAEAHWYDYQITNDNLDACVAEFITVLRENGCGG